MKIGNKRNDVSTRLIVGIILLLSVVYIFTSSKSISTAAKDKSAKKDIERPTVVYRGYSYSDIVSDTINSLYSDDQVSVYLNREFNAPFLLYVYRDSLNERQRSDRFYLHVYKRDTVYNEKGKRKFLNMDFNAEPSKMSVDGKEYYMFKKFLEHDSLNLKDIDYINTGRFKRGESVSLSLSELRIIDTLGIEITNNLPRLNIRLKQKDYQKIIRKRDEAVANGVLISE